MRENSALRFPVVALSAEYLVIGYKGKSGPALSPTFRWDKWEEVKKDKVEGIIW